MYCGQCGKKVMENMLFCPFCGSPIVIPDQDGPAVEASAVIEAEPAAELDIKASVAEEALFEAEDADHPQSLFAYEESSPRIEKKPEKEEFIPLSFDFEQQIAQDSVAEEENSAPEEDDAPEANVPFDVMEELSHAPVRRPEARFRRPENAPKRTANTYIPIKEIDPEDMFMDGFDDGDDDYDMDDAPVRSRRSEPDFDFEEPEHGSFFQRHIRGIVGLILLFIMVIICAAWAFSPKGQESLARVNLAWKAEAYADLGYEAYRQDSDLLAARYYEKALSRDEANYEYAHSAMVAYYEAEEIESAAAMLKKCVEMAPNNPEPYQEMLILYPDAQTRPWEISELIRLGYQRTGNEALNIT